jgi:hypothetical protein
MDYQLEDQRSQGFFSNVYLRSYITTELAVDTSKHRWKDMYDEQSEIIPISTRQKNYL